MNGALPVCSEEIIFYTRLHFRNAITQKLVYLFQCVYWISFGVVSFLLLHAMDVVCCLLLISSALAQIQKEQNKSDYWVHGKEDIRESGGIHVLIQFPKVDPIMMFTRTPKKTLRRV